MTGVRGKQASGRRPGGAHRRGSRSRACAAQDLASSCRRWLVLRPRRSGRTMPSLLMLPPQCRAASPLCSNYGPRHFADPTVRLDRLYYIRDVGSQHHLVRIGLAVKLNACRKPKSRGALLGHSKTAAHASPALRLRAKKRSRAAATRSSSLRRMAAAAFRASASAALSAAALSAGAAPDASGGFLCAGAGTALAAALSDGPAPASRRGGCAAGSLPLASARASEASSAGVRLGFAAAARRASSAASQLDLGAAAFAGASRLLADGISPAGAGASAAGCSTGLSASSAALQQANSNGTFWTPAEQHLPI